MNAEKKASLKIALIAGLIFIVIFGIIQAFASGIQAALISSPIAAILFVLFIYLFLNSKTVKKQTALSAKDEPFVIHSGPANHFKNAEAVGGKLYLFPEHLEFRSHQFNIQNHAFAIEIDEIKELAYYKTLGLVPNGLELRLKDGQVEKFIVNKRDTWKVEIEKLLA